MPSSLRMNVRSCQISKCPKKYPHENIMQIVNESKY